MYLINDEVKIVGADVFITQKAMPKFKESYGKFKLCLISNRGTKIWPGPLPKIELVDVFRCRFRMPQALQHADVLELLKTLEAEGFEWVHVEKLLNIKGKDAFAKIDGELS